MFSNDSKARKRITELEDELLKLRREFHALELEWSNAYDKLTTMMQRVAKRAEVLQKEMDGGTKPLSPDEESIRDDLANSANGGMLTPRQKAVQQQILRRRAGMS